MVEFEIGNKEESIEEEETAIRKRKNTYSIAIDLHSNKILSGFTIKKLNDDIPHFRLPNHTEVDMIIATISKIKAIPEEEIYNNTYRCWESQEIIEPVKIIENGYIYFLQVKDTNIVKIGKSKTPIRRMKEISSALAVLKESTPIKILYVKDYHYIEKQIHSQFTFFRIPDRGQGNEWFEFTNEVIEEIISNKFLGDGLKKDYLMEVIEEMHYVS